MSKLSNQNKTVAILAAMCLFLSTVEYLIPKPIPFLRLGIANLPILLSLYIVRGRDTVKLVLIKIIGQSLINGTLFSYIFLFSAAGTIASGTSMMCIKKIGKNHISPIGVSITGAFAANCAQLIMAYFILFEEQTRVIAPPFLSAGLVTSVIIGVTAHRFMSVSKWVQIKREALYAS